MLDVPDDPEWEARLPTVMLAYNTAVRMATNLSPFFLTYLRDPAMPFFQLGDMGRPFYGEDWAADALRRMRDVYAYTADKINQEGERNKKLYDSASGKHHEFLLGEKVYVRLDRQSFANIKNKKWIKCWKEALITRVLSDTTYEVQYVASDGALGRKSIVHRNRLKGVCSQVQKDILAETQRKQEAALSGRLGVSDEQDGDSDGEGVGDQRGSNNIWRAHGDDDSTMWKDEQQGAAAGGQLHSCQVCQDGDLVERTGLPQRGVAGGYRTLRPFLLSDGGPVGHTDRALRAPADDVPHHFAGSEEGMRYRRGLAALVQRHEAD